RGSSDLNEVLWRRVRGQAGEEADGEVERSPPRVDGRRATTIGRAEGCQHERRAGPGREVGAALLGVLARLLLVLVERRAPWDLLRRGVDLDGAGEGTDGLEQLP